MSCTTIAWSGAAAKSSAVRAQIAGWVVASGEPSTDSLSPKQFAPIRLGPDPVVRDHAGTESFADRGEGRHPGSTTSLAIRSASMTTAPRPANRAATLDFPDPIPPVNPTRSMAARYQYHRDTRARSFRAEA